MRGFEWCQGGQVSQVRDTVLTCDPGSSTTSACTMSLECPYAKVVQPQQLKGCMLCEWTSNESQTGIIEQPKQEMEK